MLINTIRNILLLLIFVITSCIEPFSIDKSNSEEVLVVEGMITNDPGPYKIYLSKTTSLTNPIYNNPVTDATVKIIDDINYEETLTQTEPGVFITDTMGIRGTVGRKYKIVIETFDGKKYESDYSELKEPVPIDDLYCEFELKHDFVTGTDTEGYKFYSKLQPYIDKNTYLMWLSVETFQREVPFTIDYLWVGYFQPFKNPDTFKICWNTREVSDIITLINDPKRNTQSITVPLNHSELRKFAIKYSLLTKQLSIDNETNQYWKAVNDLNNEQNSFYNQQPYQIRGNIQNVKDPNETVLGYFFAAGISKKRIFQSHPGIQTDQCLPDFDSMRFMRFWPESMWPIMIVDMGGGALAQGSDYCFDCRIKGGSIERPDFWE